MSGIGPDRLRELLAAHSRALTLFARQWSDAPEDLVQQAFLRLVRQRPVPERPAAWLFRVVRNEGLAWVRAEGRRKRRESAAAEARGAWFEASPEEGLDAAAAVAALGELDDPLREVVVARLWGELTFEEIGRLTEVSSSTAQRRYEEGLGRLRRAMGVGTGGSGTGSHITFAARSQP